MLKKINHIWRIFATGLCFSLFGIGGLLLTVFVFPLQKIIISDSDAQKKVARKTVHYTFKFFIAFMGLCRIFKFDLEKAQALRTLKGELVLANHPSLIDVVVLISIMPNADCVVKAHLFKNPFLRGVVRNTGYISNADPQGLLADCSTSLAAGNNLIIFPEGTRTKPGQKIKFQRGAANIALRCLRADKVKREVITVLLTVNPTTLTKSEPWYIVPEHKALFSAQLIENNIAIPTVNESMVSKQVRGLNDTIERFFTEMIV
ncbi:1-acyl-sn-glycerol-3-phosphate acyltransferase [Litorilituus lipolyticus]|uniref:1-acyl-sn-glycerol-3-phosphate acyltransferase n=1 Tax=Litorilituus lipolyticus TaxID=2491017 RepID=A0A502KRH5_9GAMM|nr:lysophospholipid acyltransferase family protein [Litorilituus lipolyticus]TPH12213.1 1-acyl-sn-glycerol-3-phosphate acyltransferase [Litorilituus lipolyticus]